MAAKVARSSRFGDWTDLKQLCQSGKVTASRSFYAGARVDARMDLIRRTINHIRIHWGNYSEFMDELRAHIWDESDDNDVSSELRARTEALLSSRVDWVDTSTRNPQRDYHAVSLYTSQDGYSRTFSAINLALREDASEVSPQLRAAVFMVELLTIDLFNYSRANPIVAESDRHVYRGMSIAGRDLALFGNAVSGDIAERYVSIPLGMMSTSTRRDVAMDFAMSQASIADDTYPLLWNIQVVDLRPSLLALYARTVPRSVVSPICAVPISDLSDFPDEAEVLLRGPFFQLLGLRTEKVSDGREIFVLDVVMVTANRDHVSSVSLSDHETDRARNLFRTMVELERAERCVAYATQHGLTSDAEAYTVSSRQLQARLGEFDE